MISSILRQLAGSPRSRALIAAVAIVLAAQWQLLCGRGVVGGDPDKVYLPMKSELQRAMADHRLPHWSPYFGLGAPLLAESQVAALYPINWVLYPWLELRRAYDWNQLLHVLVLALAMFAYLETIGSSPWGAALGTVSFSLCGFSAMHQIHEPLVLAMAWLPLALLATERLARGESSLWGVVLSLVLAAQLLVGHFQLQFFTLATVLVVGLCRIWQQREELASPARLVGLLVVAVILASGLAAPQLLPTWELTGETGWRDRSPERVASYMYLVQHLPQLVFARLFQLPEGPLGPYWYSRGTNGYESHFYVGLVPLMLTVASCSLYRRCRTIRPWCFLGSSALLLSFGESAWGERYAWLASLPGLGYFRAPARLTMLASFAAAVSAALALTHLRARPWPRWAATTVVSVGIMLAFSLGVGVADGWLPVALSRTERIARVAWSLPPLLLAGLGIWGWRRRGWLTPALVLLTGLEMGLFFNATPVGRDRASNVANESPVLRELASPSSGGRIAGLGVNQNLPVLLGRMNLQDYLGITHPCLLDERIALLLALVEDPSLLDRMDALWDLFAVEQVVWDGPTAPAGFELTWEGVDPLLDRLLRGEHQYAPPQSGTWRIFRRPAEAVHWARVVSEIRVARDRQALLRSLTAGGLDLDRTAVVLPDERLPFRPAASVAGSVTALAIGSHRVQATVDHGGPAYLLLSQLSYPGWRATVDGHAVPISEAFGCLQLVPLPGDEASRVELVFEPVMFGRGVVASLGAATILIVWVVWLAWARGTY